MSGGASTTGSSQSELVSSGRSSSCSSRQAAHSSQLAGPWSVARSSCACPPPGGPRQPRQAAGVLVLRVRLEALAPDPRVELLHAAAVQVEVTPGVDADDGVDALAAAGDDGGARQVHRADHAQLLLDRQRVGLDEGVAVLRHVRVADAATVQRVEAYPGAHLRVVVPQDRAEVGGLGELLPELAGGSPAVAPRGDLAAVRRLPALADVAHPVRVVEERRQVGGQLPAGGQAAAAGPLVLDPGRVGEAHRLGPPEALVGPGRRPAGGHGHAGERAGPDVPAGPAAEAGPLPRALALVVPLGVAPAPLVPRLDGKPRLVQGEPNVDPLLVPQARRVDVAERVDEVLVSLHGLPSPSS